MRHTLKAAIPLAALALLGSAALGTAQAQPVAAAAGLYAPSALVLSVTPGDSPATAERAVTLHCAPRAGGSHPAPQNACAELRSVQGQFSALVTSSNDRVCTREWSPVTVAAAGIWDGRRTSWSVTFGNPCEMRAGLEYSSVFNF